MLLARPLLLLARRSVCRASASFRWPSEGTAALVGAVVFAGMVASVILPGCAEMRGASAPLLAIGEALCETFLSRELPTGAALVCKGAESFVDKMMGHVLAEPEPKSTSPMGGGGVAPPERRQPRNVTDPSGNLFAVVPMTTWESRRAQDYVRAKWVAAMPVPGSAR